MENENRNIKVETSTSHNTIITYARKIISNISDIINHILTGCFNIVKHIFKSVEFFNLQLLMKWIGLTCFLATVIKSCPEKIVGSEVIDACNDYLFAYKSVILFTKNVILDVFYGAAHLETQLQLSEQQYLQNIKEIKSFTAETIKSINQEHSKNLKDLVNFTENTIKALQSVNESKISFLEQEIQRINLTQLETAKETSKLILSNQELMSSLARVKNADTLSQIGVTLGIIHGGLGGLLALRRLLWGDSIGSFSSENLDTLDYIKEAIDALIPATIDQDNPVMPENTNTNRRSSMS